MAPFGYRFLPPEQAASVPQHASLEEAMQGINEAEHGTLLVLGPQDRLLGMLADVDLRKYILKRGAMDAPVTQAMNTTPEVLAETFSVTEFMECSRSGRNQRRVLPCVGADGQLIGVVSRQSDA